MKFTNLLQVLIAFSWLVEVPILANYWFCKMIILITVKSDIQKTNVRDFCGSRFTRFLLALGPCFTIDFSQKSTTFVNNTTYKTTNNAGRLPMVHEKI